MDCDVTRGSVPINVPREADVSHGVRTLRRTVSQKWHVACEPFVRRPADPRESHTFSSKMESCSMIHLSRKITLMIEIFSLVLSVPLGVGLK
jgi:hypothetical protein